MRYKLLVMGAARRIAWVASAALGVASIASIVACPGDEKPTRPTAASRTATVTAPTGPPPAEEAMTWDPAVGNALVLAAGESPDSVSVILPGFTEGKYPDTGTIDLRPAATTRYALFGRGGAFGEAVLRAGLSVRQDSTCSTWPAASISQAKSGWQVALAAGRATAVSLDSIEALPQADSARLAAEVTRLAAGLPATRDSVFTVVPFVVRNAYRFGTVDGDVVVATLQRSIHSEANPREEQVFLIAERPAGSSGGYQVAFSTRSAGEAGWQPVGNVLAVVTLTQGHRFAMIVSSEYEDGGTVDLVERVAPRRWRLTWRSAYTGC